jgi:hypothetical protein
MFSAFMVELTRARLRATTTFFLRNFIKSIDHFLFSEISIKLEAVWPVKSLSGAAFDYFLHRCPIIKHGAKVRP